MHSAHNDTTPPATLKTPKPLPVFSSLFDPPLPPHHPPTHPRPAGCCMSFLLVTPPSHLCLCYFPDCCTRARAPVCHLCRHTRLDPSIAYTLRNVTLLLSCHTAKGRVDRQQNAAATTPRTKLPRAVCAHSSPGRRVMMPTATVRPPSRSATRPSACRRWRQGVPQVGWEAKVPGCQANPSQIDASHLPAHCTTSPNSPPKVVGTASSAATPTTLRRSNGGCLRRGKPASSDHSPSHPVVGIVLHTNGAGGGDLHHRRLALEQAARPRPLHLSSLRVEQRHQAADVARLPRCSQRHRSGRCECSVAGASVQLQAQAAHQAADVALCSSRHRQRSGMGW